MAPLSTRGLLIRECVRVINTSPRTEARRAWSLFRQLRDHDTVDLADNRLFWELLRACTPSRYWVRAAMWFTVCP